MAVIKCLVSPMSSRSRGKGGGEGKDSCSRSILMWSARYVGDDRRGFEGDWSRKSGIKQYGTKRP